MKNFLVTLLVLFISACGGSGDTDSLIQTVEQNKLNITSLVLKSKFTQTLVPANTPGAIPTFYFTGGDSEQIIVTGLNENGEEFSLSSVTLSIVGGGASTIDSNGVLKLENLADISSKTIVVQADYSSISSTANIIISTFHLQANGLNLLINNNIVNSLTETVTVCDQTAFTATGVFDDGSTRTLTRKIDWPNSIANADVNNVKFDVSDRSNPLFSSHTNTDININVPPVPYKLSVSYNSLYDSQTAIVDMQVNQGDFSGMKITPTSSLIKLSSKQSLSLTANLNGQSQSNFETKAKWLSDNPTIVEVNSATGEVTGKSVGGPIDVTASCGGEVQISRVTVNNPVLLFVEIRDSRSIKTDSILFPITTGVSKTTKLTLYAHYNDGSVENVSTKVAANTWSLVIESAGANAITINANNGIVTANAQGIVVITATYQGKEDTIRFTVTEK